LARIWFFIQTNISVSGCWSGGIFDATSQSKVTVA
jgi:hypothetical protein